MSSPDPDNERRILFTSPFCLLDTTSGAAISMHELLLHLVLKGFTCEAVTASIFDSNHQVLLDQAMDRHGLSHITQQEMIKGIPFIQTSYNGVTHTILQTHLSQRQTLNSQEEEALLSLVEKKIEEFKPDLLLTFGGLSAEKKIHGLGHRNRIPIVFYLVNGLYKKAETFSEVDLILVPSKFLSEFYSRHLGLRSQVLHDIVRKDRYFAAHRNPRFITYINPVPQKGLTLFARLVAEALKQLPTAEFLVVEGRWNQAEVARTGLKLDRIPNIRVMPNQTDMKPVYAETKILLFPSFSDEASGRSIIEAQLNGIPILASQRGGIPENLNGGGFLFDIPERCAKSHIAVPTPEEVQPWIDQLRLLLEDRKAYEEAQRRAFQAARDFKPENIVQRAIELFQELLKRKGLGVRA